MLVLSSTLQQAEHLHHIISGGKYPDIQFRYPATLTAKPISLQSLHDDCCDVIKEEDIDVIVSVLPGMELVHAALIKRFPRLKGPSFESVFIGLHRHYAKEVACSGFQVIGSTIHVKEVSIESVDSILEDVGTPALLKEAYNFDVSYSRKVKNGSSLCADLDVIRTVLEEQREHTQSFLKSHLEVEHYEKSLDTCFVLEEYVKPGKHSGTLHLVEGCIVQDVVVPWCISDIGVYKHKPVVVKYVTCPSQLNDSVMFELWAVYREVVQRLISHGLDNQFVEMEIFIGNDQVMKITNLRPCLNPANIPLYRHVLMNGDSLLAQTSAGRGHVPWEPRAIPERCALRARLSSQVYNVTLDCVVDIPAAKSVEGLSLTQSRNDFLIEQAHADEDGVRLGELNFYENNFSDCVRKMKLACKRALKDWHKHVSTQHHTSESPVK